MEKISCFLICDNTEILKLFDTIEIEGAKILSFSTYTHAFQNYSTYKPKIVVSNILIPGVEEITFQIVTKDITNLDQLFIISSSSKEDLEIIHAKLKVKVFLKPLGDEFCNFMKEVVNKVNNQTFSNSSPIKSINFDLEKKVDVVQKLFHLYKELQDYLYQSTVKSNYTLVQDEDYYDQVEDLNRKIVNTRAVLDIDYKTHNKISSQFSQHETNASTRIRADLKSGIKSLKIVPEYPFKIRPVEVRFEDLSHNNVFEIHSFELLNTSGLLELNVNDKKIKLTKSLNDKFFPLEKDVLESLWINTIFKNLDFTLKEIKARHKRALFFPEIPSFSTTRQLSIHFLEPLELSDGSLVSRYELTDVKSNFDYGARSTISPRGEKKLISGLPVFITLPREFTLKGDESVDVIKHTDYQYSLFHNKKEVLVPVELMIQDEVQRGFNDSDTVYHRAECFFRIAWDIALGISCWGFGRHEIELSALYKTHDLNKKLG